MRLSLIMCIGLLVAAAQPASVLGQDGGRAEAVGSVSAGDSVRLDVAGLGQVEGRFVVSNSTTLTLASRGASTQVRLADLERLWVRGRATRNGAVIGSVAGLVVGIVGGLLISGVACDPVDGGDCTAAEVATVTGLLGGAGGAAVGAGIGFAIPVWRLRFP